ncbi:MAG: PAS domain-containing sensor histidine kinase [Chloroflexi bacterium]|nr:PAS domain-containing sensor histidine kinase [Chloroflexota bacterium]
MSVAVIALLRTRSDVPTAVLLYLVPITIAATRWGRGPALVGATLAALAHDYFFVEPVGALTVDPPDQMIGLVLLVFTALVMAQLAEAARQAGERQREAIVARRSDELKTALLHAVSHDLRTPLASIKANVSGLRQSEVTYSEADRAELLAAIDEEADRLDRLVANLLEASQLEAGALVPHKQPQDLVELVDAVLARLGPALRAAHHDVKVAIQPNMPLVRCDYAQVDQIVTNLLENAVRHTPPGTSLEIRLSADADAASLEVADTGPGIPPADRERIFRPFERRGGSSGSGLGLSIARGLAEAHGGHLELCAAPAGACFRLTLPL